MTSTLTLTRTSCIAVQPPAGPNWLVHWVERRRRKRERRQLLSAAEELLRHAQKRAPADASYAADLEAAALAALDEINARSVAWPAAWRCESKASASVSDEPLRDTSLPGRAAPASGVPKC